MMVVDGNTSVTGTDDAGVAFARTFDFIKADQSPAKALSFITDVSIWLSLSLGSGVTEWESAPISPGSSNSKVWVGGGMGREELGP